MTMTPLSDILAHLDSHDVLAIIVVIMVLMAVFAGWCIVMAVRKL
jgi:hypothetical protein